MTEPTPDDRWAMHDLVCRFLGAFDEKDYEALRACLADVIWCDYTSFRGVPAEFMEADRYVRLRRAALNHLGMQHNLLNLRVWAEGGQLLGRCNYIIHRFAPDHSVATPRFFHSYGVYHWGFTSASDGWRISSITQVLLSNVGDPEIHGATRAVDNTARLA